MPVTIRSIAAAAGVSRGTVDKVLNDRIGVSHEVREKVKKIAEEMGYKPNLAGKALAFQKKPLKIGVIILNKHDYLFQEVFEGVNQAYEELKDFGVTVEYCLMESVDVQEQLQCIKKLRKSNISALVLSPLDEDVIRTELKKLTDKNIKIVTYNTDIVGIERLCFVGQDAKKSGRVAGQIIGEILPQGGNVVIITSEEKIKALQDRIAGFEEIIKSEYPNIRIVDILKNISDNEASYKRIVEFFNGQKDLKAIYITARGIGEAGRAIRDIGRKDIKFVCFDTKPDAVALLKERIIDFAITQEPFMQGYLPIKIVFDYFFQNKIPSKDNLYTRLEIKTKENIES